MFKACQTQVELDGLIRLFQREEIRSYLEIGCYRGGSLWQIANSMPGRSRIVAVDMPWYHKEETQSNLENCFKQLHGRGFDIHLFLGDSTDTAIVEKVIALGPYDACLIDANHAESYVRADWANYGPLARVVAFHDINWPKGATYEQMHIDVAIVWEELKSQYRHEEIVLDDKKHGFGILWRR